MEVLRSRYCIKFDLNVFDDGEHTDTLVKSWTFSEITCVSYNKQIRKD